MNVLVNHILSLKVTMSPVFCTGFAVSVNNPPFRVVTARYTRRKILLLTSRKTNGSKNAEYMDASRVHRYVPAFKLRTKVSGARIIIIICLYAKRLCIRCLYAVRPIGATKRTVRLPWVREMTYQGRTWHSISRVSGRTSARRSPAGQHRSRMLSVISDERQTSGTMILTSELSLACFPDDFEVLWLSLYHFHAWYIQNTRCKALGGYYSRRGSFREEDQD